MTEVAFKSRDGSDGMAHILQTDQRLVGSSPVRGDNNYSFFVENFSAEMLLLPWSYGNGLDFDCAQRDGISSFKADTLARPETSNVELVFVMSALNGKFS